MRIITVAGGNLFQIAADYLSDPTQWTRIALLNGLEDPMIKGLSHLRIPDPPEDRGGPGAT